MLVKPSAQTKLLVTEPAVSVEEAGEAVEVEVESAIHQRGQSPISQFPFLFGAEEQIIQLIGKSIFWILLEERLKRSFPVLFVGDCEFAFQAQGARQSGLADPAGSDDDDEFVHDFIIKDSTSSSVWPL